MRAVAAGAVALLVVGCQAPAPQEMTAAEKAQIEAEVGAVGDQWLAAASEINVRAFLDLFDPANTYAVDGAFYANYDDWTGHIERLFPTWQEVNLAWANTRVDVLGPDAAMFVGQMKGTRTRTSGATSEANVGITLLVGRIEGVWRITFQGSAPVRTPVEES